MKITTNNIILILFGIIIICLIIKYKKTKEKYGHCTAEHRKANREKCGKDICVERFYGGHKKKCKYGENCVEPFYGGCGSSVPHTHTTKKTPYAENFYGGHEEHEEHEEHEKHEEHKKKLKNKLFDPLKLL